MVRDSSSQPTSRREPQHGLSSCPCGLLRAGVYCVLPTLPAPQSPSRPGHDRTVSWDCSAAGLGTCWCLRKSTTGFLSLSAPGLTVRPSSLPLTPVPFPRVRLSEIWPELSSCHTLFLDNLISMSVTTCVATSPSPAGPAWPPMPIHVPHTSCQLYHQPVSTQKPETSF